MDSIGSDLKHNEVPATLWGETLTATGGTLLFLLSLFSWVVSGSISLQQIVFALALNLLSVLPVAVSFMPRTKNTIRATIILASLVIYIPVSGIGAAILSSPNLPIINILVLLGPVSLLLVGAVLVLLSR